MPEKTTRKRTGFTLVEFILAMVAATIVLCSTAFILVAGHRCWNNAWRQANLQRDASFAMLKITRAIRGAQDAYVAEEGKDITINYGDGWVRFWLIQGQNELRYQQHGEDEQTLLTGTIDDVNFEVENGKVTVELWLSDESSQADLTSTIMMRNYAAAT